MIDEKIDPVRIVGSCLSVPKQYTQPTWTTNSSRVIILVQKNWLKLLIANNSVPKFVNHELWTNEEVEAALLMNQDITSMQKVLVEVFIKNYEEKAISLPSPRSRNPKEDAGLSYPQLLHYVSHTNFKNLWKHQYKRYLGDKMKRHRESSKTLSTQSKYSVMRDVILRFYGCPVINVDTGERVTDGKIDYQAHINILPAACVVETMGFVLVLHPIGGNVTLKDFVTFSPGVFHSDLNKSMFIGYQILQAFRDSHDRAVILGDIRLEDVFIGHDLFIQIVPKIESNVITVVCEDVIASSRIPRPPVDTSLSTISQKWAIGDVSNFEYIMRLNEAAGRRFGNPSCHFILPWVSDLSTRSNGVWRDLSRSKFRLNKGDRQLDLTFEHAPSSQAPHHVTDVLSEITYYVYMARRTSQTVLCKYVRPSWVPAEYPVSIQRLYAWTPDECIPEFYTDPSIFKSIHEDLGDLELPPWAPTPEEFIKAHRDQLESRRVSDKLHHWIDLTFGYKLTGPAAVKAKNVCLHLADGHANLSTSGVVQVFTHPHPRRTCPLAGFDKQPPKRRKSLAVHDDDVHSSEPDDDDGTDLKASPLLLHRFLSLSRTSLLAPFQSSSEEALAVRSSTGSASSATGSYQPVKPAHGTTTGCLDNPLALLNAVESNFNFHLRTFGTVPQEPDFQQDVVKLKKMVAGKRLQEMQIFGCLLLELFLYSDIRVQKTNTIDDRISACFREISNESLPHSVRSALRLLLDQYPPVTHVGLPPPSAHQILQPLLFSSILPFPVSMPALYNAVAKLKTLERYEADADLRVKFITDELKNVLSSKIIDLVVPFVRNLLEDPSTSLALITDLLDKVFSFLGVSRTNQHFLETLVGLYERSPSIPALYHQRFLLILMIRCGLKNFVSFFVPLVVEATGRVMSHALDVPHCDDEESSPETEERPSIEPKPELGVFAFDREDTPSDGESLQNLMEQLTGTSDDDEEHIVNEPEVLTGLRSPPIPVGTHSKKLMTIECDIGSKNSPSSLQTPSTGFDEMVSKSNDTRDVHEIAANSILWMSRRLGPVLTAKHVTRNLLKMLTLCYTGPGALASTPITHCDEVGPWKLSIARHKTVGDENAAHVVQCLKQLVDLYGDQLILVQYFPFMSDLIAISKRKLTYSVEGGVVGALALLRNVVSLLSDATLMDNLQDIILKDILHPLVRLMMTVRNPFPSGHLGRMALATKILDTLYFLAVHIGAEMTRVHLAVPSLQKFFLAFDRAIGLRIDTEDVEKIDSQTAGDELRRVFSPGLAHAAYLAFFRLLGEGAMQCALVNHDFIRRLCLQHEKQTDPSSKQRNLIGVYSIDFLNKPELSTSVSVVGNKIEIQEEEESTVKNVKDISRQIRGNWLAYWEHEIGRSDKDTRFNFKQIKLQTFAGHTHAIRCLEVLDNENSLVSGSRDKTVKLWSLRSHGDGTAVTPCKFTYNGHRKSLIGVAYLSGPRLVASCDSSLHLWDPFVGKPVAVVDGKSACSALRAVDNLVMLGTSDSALRMVDARTASNVAELKLTWSPGGLVRCICASLDGSWAAVGQSSGYITVLRLRTALVVATWKAHEGEVLQIAAVDDNTILSSSLDQNISVWNIHDGKLKFHLKGPTEPVHCLKTHGSELITGTTANRIGVHTGLDVHAGFSSTKLRSDTFKGVLMSMAVLPLNMQLVLGADTGHITLLC